MTFRQLVAAAAGRLEAAGLDHDEAAQSAVVLARFTLGWTGADWVARSRDTAGDDFRSRFDPLIERRATFEPVAYLTGEREFYGRAFHVTPDVLIPRPETELIVDLALALPVAPSRIIDVGTGSGCLAITLALEFPEAHVLATDVSLAALAIARANAGRLGVVDRVEFKHAALLGGGENGADLETADLIVANPPYIDPADRATLPRDVADHEPALALFAEAHGLAVIRALVARAPAVLSPSGRLLMEMGQGQDSEVRTIVERTPGLAFIGIRPDLRGIPRVLVARADDRSAPGRLLAGTRLDRS